MPVEIGHSLKHSREARGLSLEDVARYTGISLEHLMAIEEGRLHDLPSPFYARSYLRRYASCVGVPSDMILHRYRSLERNGLPGQITPSTPVQLRERRRTTDSLREDSPMRVEPSEGKRAHPPSRVQERRLGRHSEEGREEWVEGDAPSSFRRVSLPPDMPDPQEVGLPPRSPGKSAKETQTKKDQEVDVVSLRRSRRLKKTEKEEESTFGIWYTRFLIVGGVLLILASIGLIIMKFVDDKPVMGQQADGFVTSEEPHHS